MYKCYSVSMLPGTERDNVDRGGRIFLPPSALDQLTRLNIVYPMLFKVTNPQQDRVTHCGVLEFVADEGKCYMPYWMMRNLLLEEGSMVNIESVSLPVATFSKFQPQSVEFLDITNPKAVLENELRSFACLTTGDVIAISYNDRIYELCVLETKPGPAVSIIECDMNVDFAPPVGYVEPTPETKKEKAPAHVTSQPKSRGYRLDGKSTRDDVHMVDVSPKTDANVKRGIPDYDFKPGYIKFFR
ncbi:Ubiquitin fusion degradation protein 1-like protein, partial [Fragariocoptes setiger]